MKGYVLRSLCSVFALWLLAVVMPGIEIRGPVAWLLTALAVGLANGLARTVVVFYVLPPNVLTIAALTLAINGILPGLAVVTRPGVRVTDVASAVASWLAIAIVTSLATLYVGPDGTLKRLIPRQRRHGAR